MFAQPVHIQAQVENPDHEQQEIPVTGMGGADKDKWRPGDLRGNDTPAGYFQPAVSQKPQARGQHRGCEN